MKTNRTQWILAVLFIIGSMLGSGCDFGSNETEQIEPDDPEVMMEKVTELVANQKEVRELMELTEKLSNGERSISLIPLLEDETEMIYTVKVSEDIGERYLTHMNYWVNAKEMKIIRVE